MSRLYRGAILSDEDYEKHIAAEAESIEAEAEVIVVSEDGETVDDRTPAQKRAATIAAKQAADESEEDENA